ncbi:hypothetical protein GRAN_4188 [Granulicella sibirica]|uniref:Uncharacterized protein n=1 Tax=Granulicella sibirica TaxID=2479048 RepID=A0A4V1L5A5_9BACT|nr:hypothetical protein GRAN_4188 [Granulicella sibirica]
MGSQNPHETDCATTTGRHTQAHCHGCYEGHRNTADLAQLHAVPSSSLTANRCRAVLRATL